MLDTIGVYLTVSCCCAVGVVFLSGVVVCTVLDFISRVVCVKDSERGVVVVCVNFVVSSVCAVVVSTASVCVVCCVVLFMSS